MNSQDRYLTYWRQRDAAIKEQNQRLAWRARADAARIAVMLRELFGVGRVILFGSLVSGRFAANSDIDLAVANLAPADLFRALAEAGKLSEFPIDIKPLEELTPHFRERVLATGEEL